MICWPCKFFFECLKSGKVRIVEDLGLTYESFQKDPDMEASNG